MAEVTQEPRVHDRRSTLSKVMEALQERPLPARLIQVGLGAWLILSVFLWEHSRVQSFVAWTVGGLSIVLSLASIKLPTFRMLLGLAAVWLLIGTLTATAAIATIANNILCSLLLLGLCFVPRTGLSLFRAHRRRQATHPPS